MFTDPRKIMKERVFSLGVTVHALSGLLIIPMTTDSSCRWMSHVGVCPNAHIWFYLPVGVFLSAAALSAYRVIMPLGLGLRGLSPMLVWPRSDIALQCGIIVAGYLAALSIRAAYTPLIHHERYEIARYDVGLALFMLMFVPGSKSWQGTILSLASGALILNHWFG